jgi:hypothetical protein
VSGHRDFARAVTEEIRRLTRDTGGSPFVVASSYGQASLLAFYLPGQPVVFSATSYLGGRSSSYDYFHDTRLDEPLLEGRPVVLVGGDADAWAGAFSLEGLETADADRRLYRASRYGGIRKAELPEERAGRKTGPRATAATDRPDAP